MQKPGALALPFQPRNTDKHCTAEAFTVSKAPNTCPNFLQRTKQPGMFEHIPPSSEMLVLHQASLSFYPLPSLQPQTAPAEGKAPSRWLSIHTFWSCRPDKDA